MADQFGGSARYVCCADYACGRLPESRERATRDALRGHHMRICLAGSVWRDATPRIWTRLTVDVGEAMRA